MQNETNVVMSESVEQLSLGAMCEVVKESLTKVAFLHNLGH